MHHEYIRHQRATSMRKTISEAMPPRWTVTLALVLGFLAVVLILESCNG